MSNMRTSIKCNCGQRIVTRDVVQHGYYLRLFGPSFVYIKFRCSRCKKMGEQFIKQEEWEGGILKDAVLEVSADEKERFAAQGPIDMDEVIDVHFRLEDLGSLSSIDAPAVPPPAAPAPRRRAARPSPKS